jgi:TPR repeat protein
MRRRGEIVARIAVCCAAACGAMTGAAVPVPASAASTATAPPQLTNAYPIGPQRLCCAGRTRPNAQATTSGRGSRPPASVSPAPGHPRPAAAPGGKSASSALPVALLIPVAMMAVLLCTGVAVAYRARRRPMPTALPIPLDRHAIAHRKAVVAAAEIDERLYRRQDENGDAEGAFNLGVVLHQRGDRAEAAAAYRRAEQRGDPDAAFNLGVLQYESGDLDGAKASWQRSSERGHARSYANLLFLSGSRRDVPIGERRLGSSSFNLGVILHQRGDVTEAIAAYERAERRGDPDAAFNLGVLLYEVGDLDGAEASWRRGVEQGHSRAAANLEFLLRRRTELKTAGLAGEVKQER